MASEITGANSAKIIRKDTKKSLQITWHDSDMPQSYPYVWLRDFCRCTTCFHPTALQRMKDLSDWDIDVVPVEIELAEENNSLKIVWSDGHGSEFDMQWLRKYNFSTSSSRGVYDEKVTYRYWGTDVGERALQFFSFDDLMTNDRKLYDWLIALRDLGIAVIRNAPRETGQLQKIGGRVAFLQPSCFG